MHLPRGLAKINRRLINPLQKIYAGQIPGHGIVEHAGRRSGDRYETPVLVFGSDNGFVMMVGYGLGSDWLKNVLAAGGGGLRHRGRHYVLSDPRLLKGDDAYKALPPKVAAFARRVNVEGVLQVSATEFGSRGDGGSGNGSR